MITTAIATPVAPAQPSNRPRAGVWALGVCLLHALLLVSLLQPAQPRPNRPLSDTPVSVTLVSSPAKAVAVPELSAITPVQPSPSREKATPQPTTPRRATLPKAAAPTTPPLATLAADQSSPAPPSEQSQLTESSPATDVSAHNDQNIAISEPGFDADYLNNPAPRYPALSRQRREQGMVLLRVHVLANGQADQLLLLESSGFSGLDAAALRAVKHWHFVPAKRGDEAIAAWVRVPVRFRLAL